MEADGNYKTTDLALAAVLSLNGLDFELQRVAQSDRAVFVFTPITDDEKNRLSQITESFSEGNNRVDPRRFMKEVRRVRDRLYTFLDNEPVTR